MRWWLTVLLFGAVSQAATASDTVRVWLERMNRAMETLSYRGTLVYMHDDRLDMLKLVRHHGEQGLRERIITLTGSRREVLRENGEVRCLYPEDNSMLIEGQLAQGIFPEFSAERWATSRNFYAYRLGSDDRIAGLAAQIIEITPNDRHRYGYRLWLERDSGLLLRSVMQDKAGRIKEQIAFTEIEITDEINDSELKPAKQLEQYIPFPHPLSGVSHSPVGQPEWRPQMLPPGFELTTHDHLGESGDSWPLEHLVYSDGLASISIYIEQISGDHTGVPAQAERGGISVFSRREGDLLITTIGEAPYATVAEIGRSVRQHDERSVIASD
ncbi:MAG: MucB/RseB C-terminal domain-containing protein [Wenzhouxiangellaceae bacterium]